MTTFKTLVASNIDWLMSRSNTNANDLGKVLAEEKGKKSLQSTIHRIVSGESQDPKTASLLPIASHFDVTVDELRTHDFRRDGFPTRGLAQPSREQSRPAEQKVSRAAQKLVNDIVNADRRGLSEEAFDGLREMVRLLLKSGQLPGGTAGGNEPPP
ncbi:hypothetical protein [Burkholderia glumae]|uniref:hypothetical protein n=1 Tax=Burkholderia glumae TaxID=337 RepID=UPI0021510780|nr:hypothetical protein [Burkholderia glumae]